MAPSILLQLACCPLLVSTQARNARCKCFIEVRTQQSKLTVLGPPALIILWLGCSRAFLFCFALPLALPGAMLCPCCLGGPPEAPLLPKDRLGARPNKTQLTDPLQTNHLVFWPKRTASQKRSRGLCPGKTGGWHV